MNIQNVRDKAIRTCKYSYSSEWTEQEIKHDLVYKLLSWSGLKIKTVLDY